MAERTGEPGGGVARLGHRPELDGLRGIAILLVLWHHSLAVLLPPGHAKILLGGFLGVDVFFVLSGFLITTILLERRGDPETGSMRAFYRRRAARLLPALLGFLAADLVVALAMQRDMQRELRTLGAALTYTVNWAPTFGWDLTYHKLHLWSLGVEEQFYLIWPVVLLVGLTRLPARRALWLLATAIVLAAAWRAVLTHGYGEGYPVVHQRFDARLDALLVGAAVALLIRDGWRPSPRVARVGTLVGALVLGAWVGGAGGTNAPLYYGGFTIVALASAALVVGALHAGGVVQRCLSWRPLVALGQLSYSLYLWHVLAYVLAAGLITTPLLAPVVLGQAFALVLAAGSYVGVERPLLKRFASAPARTAPARLASGASWSGRTTRRAVPQLSALLGASVAVLGLATVAGAGGLVARAATEDRAERQAAAAATVRERAADETAVAPPTTRPPEIAQPDPAGPDGAPPSTASAVPRSPSGAAQEAIRTILELEQPELEVPAPGEVGAFALIARLTTVEGRPLAGQAVAFAIELPEGMRQCTSMTGEDGVARCRIGGGPSSVPTQISAHFAGDALLLPASATLAEAELDAAAPSGLTREAVVMRASSNGRSSPA